MVFSAAIYSNTTTGVGIREPVQEEPRKGTIVDKQPKSAVFEQTRDKHDVMTYTLTNAPIIGLAGLATGLQEAFYKFEKMGPNQTRNTLSQAAKLYSIVGRKTLYATALGAVFCYTEASLEHWKGQHDTANGMIAGALTGLVFATLPPKPLPQLFAWPIAFAATVAMADIVGEKIPHAMRNFRPYGPVESRPNWNDPAPPRPPVWETGASVRPGAPDQFFRGA